MRITILGKRWRLRWVTRREMPASYGECDHPSMPGKEIRIRKGQSPFDELDTIIHELMHAADDSKHEDWVAQVATDVARVLHKLGYRREGT